MIKSIMQPEAFQSLWAVSHETQEKFKIYHALLLKWQKQVNLIGPSTVEDIWARHFSDSLQISKLIPDAAHILDLGSGAGFPGLALALYRSDLNITLLESDQKKAEFLKMAAHAMKVSNVVIHTDRVENKINKIDSVDFITARAFASISKILQLSSAIIKNKPHLKMVLLKGENADQEIKESKVQWQYLCEKKQSLTDKTANILMISDISRVVK
jgi:16S rRNA (guanine527-N7)-methyltransferase